MKKLLLALLIVLSMAVPCFSESLNDISGDKLTEYRFQVSFMEKYFEYMAHYKSYNIFLDNVIEYDDAALMHRGIIYDLGLKVGLPGDYAAGVEVRSVFQGIDKTESNAVQNILLSLRKYSQNGLGMMAGVRLALAKNIPAAPRLINDEKKTNYVVGVFYMPELGLINLKLQAVVEQPVGFGKDYLGETDLALMTGINIYDDKTQQKISLNADIVYHKTERADSVSTAAFIVPQLSVYFYDSLTFTLGVDILAYADEIYINRYDKYLYTFKFSYNIDTLPTGKD